MSYRSKSSKSRAVQSLKSYNKPGNKEDMSSRTRSKKPAGAQVNLWRNIAAIQERCAAEEPVLVTSTDQGLEVGQVSFVTYIK